MRDRIEGKVNAQTTGKWTRQVWMASKTETQECKAMCRKLRTVSFVFCPAMLFKSIGCI